MGYIYKPSTATWDLNTFKGIKKEEKKKKGRARERRKS
jgi:hypothetical protein